MFAAVALTRCTSSLLKSLDFRASPVAQETGMFEPRSGREEQSELWVARSETAAPKAAGFYRQLNETLRASRFAGEVWKLGAPHDAEAA
jgi:hypothetical protein